MTTNNVNDNFIFIGKVESIDDPFMLGRVKVRVLNLQDDNDIDTEGLRFAWPLGSVTSASLNGVGISPTGIDVGSFVFGFFLDQRERNIPIIMGTYSKIPDGDEQKHDVSALAREINNLVKERLGPEPESAYKAKYPHNKTLTTKSGHAIEIDDTPGHERIHVYHKSGTYTEVNENGRRVQKIVGDDFEIVKNDKIVYINGNLNVEVNGNVNMKVRGNVTTNADGEINMTSSKGITLRAPRVDII